jgi:hypothetical protein
VRQEDGSLMATRERMFEPVQRELMVSQFREGLQARTIADLREAARRWGWPVRGTSKASLAEQLLGYLQDPDIMSAATASLPPEQIVLLAWLVGLGSARDVNRRLQVVLQHASGIKTTTAQANDSLRDLYERCLLLDGPLGLVASPLYLEWLPPIHAEALRATGRVVATPAMTVEWISDEVERLLSAIETEKPPRHGLAQGVAQGYDRAGQAVQPRPGLLDRGTLAAWGYNTPDRQSLAALLVELLWATQVIQVDPTAHIIPVPGRFEEWQRQGPVAQLQTLRMTWLTHPVRFGADNWNELDMALGQIERFDYLPVRGWAQQVTLNMAVLVLRQQVMGMLQAVEAGSWYSLERFCRLISELSRDPLGQNTPDTWRWSEGGKMLPPANMPFDVWLATYGRVLAAVLRGPASWLGFVEVDRKGDDLRAFRPLSAVPPGDLLSIPPDALRFAPPDTAIMRKTWKAARLRPVLTQIATEVAADRTSTTYRLDPAMFRAFLQGGGTAEQPGRELSASGFPLPSETAGKLKRWEARNGRYQLYDDLAVIELAEDMAQAEVEAIARLLGSRLFEVAPRCLLIFDREQAPAIVDELRRRGYTPRVTS